ncbi:hypothetical protein B296_00052140 [Ensete ventricosum]|uniref:Uncharacterized protein n=1 Tax=Ensete ventricosum TaxID=4639 RepID=A0A426YDG5_ENSVE|nr:hypothetical protein B296_00052140 [Ensete ventricosum]
MVILYLLPCTWEAVGDYSREDANGANLLPCHSVIVEQKESLLPSESKAESDINLFADKKSNAHSEPQSSVVMLVGNCSNVLGKNETLETKLEEVFSVPQTVAAKCDGLDADVQELCKTKPNGTLAASSDSCPTLSFQTVQNNLDLMECGTQIEKAMSSCISEYEEQLLGAFMDVAKIQDKCDFEANSTVSAAFTNAEETSSVHESSQAQHAKKSGEFINIEDFQSDYEVQQLECLTERASVPLPLEKENVFIGDKLQTAIVATQEEIPNIDCLDSILLDAQNKKICQTLAARLAHAKEEQAAAEQEKLKREDLAHKILVERVSTGSREEIAAACESVLSLKSRVHGCMPDNRPISSVTGTLVSSSSSVSEKTVLPRSDLHSPTSKSSIMIDTEATMNLPMEGDAADHHRDCSDDDWEMLEDKAELLN